MYMWHRRAKKGSLFCPFGTERERGGETATVKIELLIYGRFLQKEGLFTSDMHKKTGPFP